MAQVPDDVAAPPAPVRVLVVDDDALVRSGIRMLLGEAADVEVVGEAADGAAALDLAGRLSPDVVLMDLRMPGSDGIATTRVLSSGADSGGDPPRVLVLTTFDDEQSVAAALRAGARGFLVKDGAADHLAGAIRTIAAGGSWLDPSASAAVIRLVQGLPGQDRLAAAALERLTPRERGVLALMAQGLTNEHIGRRLVLSPATVRTHVSRILMKTGAHDRSQAVVLAYQGHLPGVPPTHGEPTR